MIRAVLLLLLLLAACPATTPAGDARRDLAASDRATSDSRRDVAAAAEARADASSVDRRLPADGGSYQLRSLVLPKCSGKGPGIEDCHARVIWHTSRCSAVAPCDRLVVYWSGGEQSCDTGAYDPLLKDYAAAGFVAACAQPYTTTDEAGAYPIYQEFDRMHELLVQLRALPDVQAAWDGSKLLISGVSHGATAPLVAIAAKAALRKHAAVWTGSSKTAVVLYDGISNPATLEEWAAQQLGCGLFHSRFVGRYGDGKPLLHSCLNKACFCSAPAHASDWAADTVVLGATAPPSPYTCLDVTPQSGSVLYRFVSCSGAGVAACGLLGDIIPDEQQTKAFDAIKGCAGVVASHQTYASCAHTQCGAKLCGLDDTLVWLKTQGW
jgi:hypothetical protein